MNPAFDALTQPSTALAPATARFDRQHAGARQQRWMAELEQAMLTQQPGQRPDDNAARPAARSADAGATSAHAAPAAAPHAGPAAAGAGQAASPAQQRHADRDDERDGDGDAITAATPHAAATADTGTGPSGIDATTVAGMAAAANGPVSAGVAVATGAGTAAAAAVEQAPPPALNGISAARAGLGFALSGMTHPADDTAATMAPPETATPDEAAGEEYSRNLLHLFHGEDGVQAYIRDAELTGAQMRAVAQALAAELGGSGTRLAALTVNGRRIALAGGTVDDGGTEQLNEDMPATAHEAAPSRLSIADKGNI